MKKIIIIIVIKVSLKKELRQFLVLTEKHTHKDYFTQLKERRILLFPSHPIETKHINKSTLFFFRLFFIAFKKIILIYERKYHSIIGRYAAINAYSSSIFAHRTHGTWTVFKNKLFTFKKKEVCCFLPIFFYVIFLKATQNIKYVNDLNISIAISVLTMCIMRETDGGGWKEIENKNSSNQPYEIFHNER